MVVRRRSMRPTSKLQGSRGRSAWAQTPTPPSSRLSPTAWCSRLGAAKHVRAFDAVTGALRWRSVDLGASGLSGIVTGLATMAVAGGLVLVPLESPPEVVAGSTPVRVRSCGGDPWPRSVGSPRSLWRVTVSLWHSENPAVWSPCNYRPGACCGRQRAAVGNQWDHRRLAQGCWWFPVFSTSGAGMFTALNAATGARRWRRTLEGDIVTVPAIRDQVVYAGMA